MNIEKMTHQQLIDELQKAREREKELEERLKQRNFEILGILAGGIAHDFNNLLTTLMGNITMARMLLHEGAKLNRVLERALETSLSGVELTQKLLTFSDGGNPVIEKKSLWPIIDDAVDSQFPKSDITIKKIIPDDLPQILCDKTQLIQVIRNLATNARQASAENGEVRIRAEQMTLYAPNPFNLPAGNYVVIAIEDDGCGITEDNIDRIFAPYFSTHSDLTQNGLGLGLSICQSIVKKHKGYIDVESEEKKGTTVRVYIPAAQ